MTKKAVALSYFDETEAPFLTAKGKEHLAEKIIQIAKENSIPVVKNIEATEVISMQEIGEYIPEETYEILAKIFAFIKSKEGYK
jgi:type III secretion system FlhB-like substrate exporter